MRTIVALSGLALAVVACGPKQSQVSRVSTSTQTDLSGMWNDTDARLTSEALVKDCFARPWLPKFTKAQGRAPKVRVRTIKDFTGERIDAQVFVKNLERAMVNSGDVEVVAQSGNELDSVNEEQDYGAGGRVSDSSAPAIGHEEGADYVLTGRLACMVDEGEGEAAKLYKVTFELIDSTSAKKVWMGDHEIKKIVKGRVVGTCTGYTAEAEPRARVAKAAPATSASPAAGAGAGKQMVDNGRGRTIAFATVRGDPATIGCSDGEREAFADVTRFPAIAGCLATWSDHRSMRTKSTGHACGDDAGPCSEPADACAAGWHVCGADGDVKDIFGRVSAADCRAAAPGGNFVGALSHCAAQSGCQYGAAQAAERNFPCFKGGWCSEPVCCGQDCGTGSCPDGIWPRETHIAQGTDQGCMNITSQRAGGVLCCKDEARGRCGQPGVRCG